MADILNLTTDIKLELVDELKLNKRCCKLAFLAGAAKGAGSLFVEHGGYGIVILSALLPLIEKCAALAEDLTSAAYEIFRKDKEKTIGKNVVYELKLEGNRAFTLLSEITETLGGFENLNNCCKNKLLKGLFAASGNLIGAAGYMLEITLSDEDFSKKLRAYLFENGVETKIRKKGGQFILYTKDSDAICDFAAFLDAPKSYFALQDFKIMRSLRNDANRASNCEWANIGRSLAAADKQLESIMYIDKKIGLNRLSPQLRETAELRLKNPSLNSKALAELNGISTKSGFNHRMRKITEIAEDLKNGGTYDAKGDTDDKN